MTSFSATCSHTTFGIARGSQVQADSLKAERSALEVVCSSTDSIQQLGANIFAAVSSAHTCGGTPSSSIFALNLNVLASACCNRVHGYNTSQVQALESVSPPVRCSSSPATGIG